MTIKSDRWITRMAAEKGMIEPFQAGQIRADENGEKMISYGVSSYGYDVRCADEFKVFTNIHSATVDPKAFDERSFVDIKGDYCIIPPNSFALARTVEYFRIPRNVLTICQCDAPGTGVGRSRDPGVFQHHHAAGKNLCSRRRSADVVLRVRRDV